jgi:ketosteroid isomerase-like protein
MSEESTTPDLVELTRRAYELSSDGDFDTLLALFDSDAVWDMSHVGLGVYQGREAIRRFFEDWRAPYEELRTEVTNYTDVDEARAAAGRLAESRG